MLLSEQIKYRPQRQQSSFDDTGFKASLIQKIRIGKFPMRPIDYILKASASRFKLSLVLIATLTLSGCGGGNAATEMPPPATLTSIDITPSSATLSSGQIAHFSARGSYDDESSSDISGEVIWRASDDTIVEIDRDTGVAHGVARGRTTVTATKDGILSREAPLEVSEAVLSAITISPITSFSPIGVPVTLTATGTYSDGANGNISGSVSWSSSDPNVATVNASGVAATLAQGRTGIIATAAGIASNSSFLTVTPPVLASIAINPASAAVAKGLTTSFTASGTYTDGTSADISDQVVWATGDSAVATIGVNTGVATGIAVGNTTVAASSRGIAAPAANLAVNDAVLTGIVIDPPVLSAPLGASAKFTSTGLYSDGSSGNISGSVAWSSSNPAVATVDVSGIARTRAQGTATIKASASGIESNSAILSVTPAVITSISVTPTTPSSPKGVPVTFIATAVYSDGTISDVSGSVSWASSNIDVATIDNSGMATTRALGSTNINATAATGVISNTTTLTVTAAQLTSVRISPVNAYANIGGTTNLTASGTYTDGSTRDITDQVIWSSSDIGVATIVSNSGIATGVSIGGAAITATADGTVSGNATLIVETGNDIAAWGDSLTPRYVAQLRTLYPTRSVFNGGVGGQKSTQIAARQGGVVPLLTIAGDVIPASGSVVVTGQTAYVHNAQGPGGVLGTLGGVHGSFNYDNISTYTFTRSSPGLDTSIAPGTPFIVDTFNRNTWINTIWSGNNNPGEPLVVKADIAAMVAFLSSANRRFVVLSTINGDFGVWTRIGGGGYNFVTQLNNDLSVLYPQNYIDVRAYLISRYDPNIPQDVIDHQNDVIPSSLRVDQVHLNDKGALLVAQKVQQFIQSKGW